MSSLQTAERTGVAFQNVLWAEHDVIQKYNSGTSGKPAISASAFLQERLESKVAEGR
jgi:hypothetical protein